MNEIAAWIPVHSSGEMDKTSVIHKNAFKIAGTSTWVESCEVERSVASWRRLGGHSRWRAMLYPWQGNGKEGAGVAIEFWGYGGNEEEGDVK